MAIATKNDWLGSQRQRMPWTKTATRTTVANFPFSVFDLAGNPGAGVLAGGQTTPPANTVGAVPTKALPGYLPLVNFAGGATGHLDRVSARSSVVCDIIIYDRLWI